MNNSKGILICGVGGQGTLLASRILGQTLIKMGKDVKMSEVHGMSQRGGSVVTYVRYSDEEVSSPVLSEGTADVVLSFELLEGYRALPFLKAGGQLITNTKQMNPMPVITGAMPYPADIEKKIRELNVNLTAFDASSLAIEAGNEKTVNVVLIGALMKIMGLPETLVREALTETVKLKLLPVNLKALDLGGNEC